MHATTTTLGQTIGLHIKQAGESIHGFEKKIGLKRGVVWAIVKGKTTNPTQQTLEKIAKGLDRSIASLYTEPIPNNFTSHTPWDFTLYSEILLHTHRLFQDKQITPAKASVLEIADILYEYSQSSGVLDKKMAAILVDKYGNN